MLKPRKPTKPQLAQIQEIFSSRFVGWTNDRYGKNRCPYLFVYRHAEHFGPSAAPVQMFLELAEEQFLYPDSMRGRNKTYDMLQLQRHYLRGQIAHSNKNKVPCEALRAELAALTALVDPTVPH